MPLSGLSVTDFLAALRSPSPTPGGGSASALAGALGASLLGMVASMPRHRGTSEDDERRLHAAAGQCAELAAKLADLVNRDSEAYDRVMAAYKLPKESPAEKAERSARIQEALTLATDVPLDVMRACVDALQQSGVVAALGNANAASDVGVALELLGAGLRGAGLNVRINLASVKDRDYADRIRQELARLVREGDEGIAKGRGV